MAEKTKLKQLLFTVNSILLLIFFPLYSYSQIRATIKLKNGVKVFANDVQGHGKDSLFIQVKNVWGTIALNEIKYISKISTKNKTEAPSNNSFSKSQVLFSGMIDSLLKTNNIRAQNSTKKRFYRFAIIVSNNRAINKSLLFNTLGFSLNNNLYIKQKISLSLGLGMFRLTNVLRDGKIPEPISNIEIMNKHVFLSYNIGINYFFGSKDQSYIKAGFSGGMAGPNSSWKNTGQTNRTYNYFSNGQNIPIPYVLNYSSFNTFKVDNFQNIDLVFGQKIPVLKNQNLLFEFGFRKTDLFITNITETFYSLPYNTNYIVSNNVSLESSYQNRVTHLSFFAASLNVGFEF